MSTSWVASCVRARAMSRRRIGRAASHALARRESLDRALDELSATPYGHDVHPGQTLHEAQHGVAATVLWHMRVLAGWVPRGDAQMLRLLAGGFETANVDARLKSILGATADPPFRLGTLATAWHAVEPATTVAGVREGLARSAWGDPGADTVAAVRLSMRLAWALRIFLGITAARDWAAGAAALLVARESLVRGRPITPDMTRTVTPMLGTQWTTSGGIRPFAESIPRHASWALDDVADVGQLWRAEAGWWARVERDGYALLRRPLTGPAPVLGSVAVLGTDAWRVRAALEIAARGGSTAPSALEAFDAVA